MSALAELRLVAESCTACTLSATRTKVVFGTGSSDAELMFIGEAPGKNEDLQGEPFVGAAGRLLNQLLEEAGIARQRVYIANVIKCRPPSNRNPEPDEVAACEPFLFRQVETIRPKVIVALGTFAAQALLRSQEPISRLRGRLYDYHGATLVPTFHPAYLLRNQASKRFTWEDMKRVRELLLANR